MINVTKTYFPPLEEYNKYLIDIWEREWITNHGPLVLELEQRLKEYFNVKHFFFVNNGTIALQIAIKALELGGEIITTPFSYVATTSSIVWEGCTPVFVDIDPVTFTINPELIEDAITSGTKAILATHVYGYPCHIKRIEEIAQRNNLKVIYDAAHAFGVQSYNRHLVTFGDVSTLSFHATKIFHTVEGGAVLTNDDEIAHKISYMRNFGHKGYEEFWGLGINGKNCELHAAMGLCILPKINEIISARKEISGFYDNLLADIDIVKPISAIKEFEYNYAYYPVVFQSEKQLLQVKENLNDLNIFPRRYFYPSLDKLNYVKSRSMPVADKISSSVLCLPLYYDLSLTEVESITDSIAGALKPQSFKIKSNGLFK